MTTATYDITPNGEYCSGRISLENGNLYIRDEIQDERTISLTNVKEMALRTYSGCASLELLISGDSDRAENSVPLCRLSMTYADELGEFCKVVNHYIETGEETDIPDDITRICPTCGRHLPKGIDVCLFCVKKKYLITRTAVLLKPYIKLILAASVLLLFSTSLSAMLPVLNAHLVDNYFSNNALQQSDLIKGILITVAMIGATQIGSGVFNMFSMRVSNRIGTKMAADLRLSTYDKIQRLSLTSMSRKTAGDLIKRVTKDTETVKSFLTEQGLYGLEKLIMFVVILVILLRISPFLTFLAVVPIPFVVYTISRFWKFIHFRYEKQWRCESRGNSLLHDIVRGIRVVKIFGNEDREIQKFTAVSKKLCDVATSNEHVWALTFPFLTFFMGIGEFFVLYFGGKAALTGTLSAGQLLEFTLFLAYLYQPMRWLSTLPRRLGQTVTSLIKLFEIADEPSDVTDQADDQAVSANGDIEFKNVQFGYRAYEPVLRDIDLKVNKGEMIGLVGHSGAGKSTLINLILRLYEPDRGCITIDGNEISRYPANKYRERIGVVFQETFLFAGSAYDNILYAKPDATPAQVIAAAKTANAHDFIMKLPDGYNTMIGENGHNLSGGERQRIAIARAILRDPDILILDEATSALDPETETAIQEALGRLIQGRTTFAIAHRLATLRNADRLVVIENGRIAEAGTHKELLLKGGIYAKLVMAQKQTAKLTNK